MRWEFMRAGAAGIRKMRLSKIHNHRISLLLAMAVSGSICAGAPAQTAQSIRIVTYNTQGDVSSPTPTGVLPNLATVIEGIGQEKYVGDSVLQLPDIVALQETTSNSTTVAPLVNDLNSYYGSSIFNYSSYQATTSDGTTDGGGPNALIYNQNTINLIASVGVGTPESGSNGEFRQVVRYEFQPIADKGTTAGIFYVYDGHPKSGSASTTDDGSTDGALRNGEAQIVRNDEATLPANAAVMYVGDFNEDGSTEAAYQTMTAAKSPSGVSQGAGIDPKNPTNNYNLSWGSSNVSLLTETDTKLEYRDDLQLLTSNIYNDSTGYLDYVANSYHPFGNNGGTAYNGSVISSSNTALNDISGNGPLTPSQVLAAENKTLGSDHLPVVADYSLLLGATWNASGGGSWSTATNWAVSSIAQQSGEIANFVNSISAPATITVDAGWTVGTIDFNSTFAYTLATGTSGVLTLNNGTSAAAINVAAGNQAINAPISLVSSATVTVSSASNMLAISGGISGAGGLTIAGSGTVSLSGLNSYLGATAVNSGQLNIGSSSALPATTTLTVGTASVAAKVLFASKIGQATVSSLAILGNSTLDLTNNSLAINYTGTSPAATIRGYLVSGYNGDQWNGTGIISSTAAATSNHSTALGYTDSGSQILIMYTWIGDTNLDGVVNAADLANMAPVGTTNATWSMGDFNYDGVVNQDDYSLFALGAAESNSQNISTTLPEPTAVAMLGAAGLGMLSRRSTLRTKIKRR
jgi:autotransporter-associated beta strand protein